MDRLTAIFGFRQRPIALLLLLFAVFCALLVVYLFNPAFAKEYPPCIVKLLTGFYCPGCGALRGLHHLLHGDFSGALRMNIMLYGLGPLLALALWRNPNILYWRATPLVLFFLIAAFGILRNLSAWPFVLLAPH